MRDHGLAALLPGTVAHAEDAALTVLAGTGASGSSGDGGPAAQAQLNTPAGVAVGADGTVYVADSGNHVVRAVSPDGVISTVAGNGEPGVPGAVSVDGATVTEAALSQPGSLAVDSNGTLFIADTGLLQVLALTGDGTLTVVAGSGEQGFEGDGGPATAARFGALGGLAVGPDGVVYIGDPGNRRIRAVALDGTIDTIAGDGGAEVTAAGGTATTTPVPYAAGLAVDGDGALWIADAGGLLRRYADGQIATVTRPESGTWGLASDDAWPPADEPLNNISTVAIGGNGTVLALDDRNQAVLGLSGDDALETVAALGRQVTGPIAGTAATVYLADLSTHQVYSAPASSSSGDGGQDESTARWLPFAIAGGVVVLLIGGWLVFRPRRRRA